ncbi:hypothetical protein SUBVAR_06277 [Subdoligranulum variabile DSM 15176]|uniref:Uncharacterized protein n=1 Tax=Subdoligranulum variabile DSM 15176 TaxID=411471 RepID=D1PPG2_9FIRM|nr:hypothetical protein SUBVAR_06277 [Subdoligranulum variabile DSM 15176]
MVQTCTKRYRQYNYTGLCGYLQIIWDFALHFLAFYATIGERLARCTVQEMYTAPNFMQEVR